MKKIMKRVFTNLKKVMRQTLNRWSVLQKQAVMNLPKISEKELERKIAKAIEQGTKDWADVPDATQWVEQMRGHEDETLKCPTCGKPLQFFNDIEFEGLGRVGCASCEWTTFLATPPKAWKAAVEFISKFPPIMRIQPGDKLYPLGAHEKCCTVLKKIPESNQIEVQNKDGGTYNVYCDEVGIFPWELEQEGVQQ